MAAHRTETDALGMREVPKDAYWGIGTLRALENFPISGMRADRSLVRAYGIIKWAAARANAELGMLEGRLAALIGCAAQELAGGALDDHIVVDVFQAGAGTSLHMNVNEVVCNRALEMDGKPRGDYETLHPNDHVNMAQSTNDTFPTAMRMALVAKGERLDKILVLLTASLELKAAELDAVLTTGRTHLQDAVPIRYGQVFRGYRDAFTKALERLAAARDALRELPIGGTAVGTGLNAHPAYAATVVRHITELSGEPFREGRNLVELMSSSVDFVSYSSAIRTVAIEVGKFCNDLRLLASGPYSGMGDLILPAVQPGSSIMPGKVNPSILEMVNQVCFQVQGNDHAVTLAAAAGQLQLNVMMPGMIHALLFSLQILPRALAVMDDLCLKSLDADRDRCEAHVHASAAMATILNPIVGYARAAQLTKEAIATRRNVVQLILERGIISKEELDRLLDPDRVTSPGVPYIE